MTILLPVIILILAAATLLTVRMIRPVFRFPWLIAVGGATLAFIGVFLWHIHLPLTFSMTPWELHTISSYSPSWRVDAISWTYALSLSALAAAVIWTSVVRLESDPIPWAGTLLISALGILAVTADNPLTLILSWSAIDLAELIVMLRPTSESEQTRSVAIAFAARLAGTLLVLWAILESQAGGTALSFDTIPPKVGIYLLVAVGLRLGVLPLHLPYKQENILRRGFGTTLRLVSAAASLSLLARIPSASFASSVTPYLLILAAIASIYAGWLWLRASDEILGRPFWVVGVASLSVAASLRGNPTGSIAWGLILILDGSMLFLFSARQRSVLWLPLLALWGMSALPFSLAASTWQTGDNGAWFFLIPFILAQSFLMAGFIRHAIHPGETSLESQERWTKVLYPTGLLLLAGTSTLLGVWGWSGARTFGIWWVSLAALILAVIFSTLGVTVLTRLAPDSTPNRWIGLFRLNWLYRLVTALFSFIRRITETLTATLEGDTGLLWSLLLLALIISVLTSRGRLP